VKLVVEGVLGLDGEYDADISYFTNRELHKVKVLTGLRAGEFEEAFKVGDNDVIVAIATVILERNGKGEAAELLWDAPAGVVTLDLGDEEEAPEVDVRPPDSSPTTSGPESSSVGKPSESEQRKLTGGSLSNGGGHPENVPSPTGSPPSDTGVVSDPVTSAS
jgi:hypothetical protein